MQEVCNSSPQCPEAFADHPADDDLEAWSRGQLTEAADTHIAGHLTYCHVCRVRLDELEEYARIMRRALCISRIEAN